ncbi:MAG: 6-phosphogluconolactonase [Abditibacteriota bacterium]|nr:6-phosphogluconolactonase [Abditibacteriota bacterium]
MSGQLIIHDTADAVVRACADRFVALAQQCVAERGRFTFSLAGGSTPKALYGLLASEPYCSQIPWQSTLILFGDERAVAPDDENSNFRMAREILFDRAPLSPQNIFRMRGEAEDLNEAAKEYGLLVQELGTSLDLCLLGMGPDGHTASLFPHTPGLHEAKHRCIATEAASLKPHVPRLTLTFRTLNAARNVWMLVTGDDKAERLKKVLCGPRDIEEQPVQGVAPEQGEMVWMLDNAATRLIRK